MKRSMAVLALTGLLMGCGTAVETPTQDVPTACIHRAAAVKASDQATQAFTDGMRSVGNYDLQSAATYLHEAATYTRTAAVAAEDDPAIYDPLWTAADQYDLAADLLAAETLNGIKEATRVLSRGSTLVDQAVTAINTTELTAC